MKLIALNKNTERYGYPQVMEYDKATFNGHQLGIAICIQNNKTKAIEENYLSEKLGDKQTRDFLLGELLREEKAVFITEVIGQTVEKEFITKTIYYMPYYVADHSRFKPTIIDDNISGLCVEAYDVQVEIVFSEDGCSRYAVMDFKTCSLSVMDLVYDMFRDGDTPCLSDELKLLGVVWEEDKGYVLDFYSKAGEQCNYAYADLEELRDAIVSVRMIDIKRYTGEKDGN